MAKEIGKYSRRNFMKSGFFLMLGLMVGPSLWAYNDLHSTPAFTLKPIGRTLHLEDYYIWCSSPIWGEDGKVHLFYSRWKKEKGMSGWIDRKSTRLNSSHVKISYAVFCLKKKKRQYMKVIKNNV